MFSDKTIDLGNLKSNIKRLIIDAERKRLLPMNLEELLKKINSIHGQLEDLHSTLMSAANDVGGILDEVDNFPSEVNEVEEKGEK